MAAFSHGSRTCTWMCCHAAAFSHYHGRIVLAAVLEAVPASVQQVLVMTVPASVLTAIPALVQQLLVMTIVTQPIHGCVSDSGCALPAESIAWAWLRVETNTPLVL